MGSRIGSYTRRGENDIFISTLWGIKGSGEIKMAVSGDKESYKKYSKSQKRFHWGFVVVNVCAASLLLAWKPYILPLLKLIGL